MTVQKTSAVASAKPSVILRGSPGHLKLLENDGAAPSGRLKFANVNFPGGCNFACPQCCQNAEHVQTELVREKEQLSKEEYVKFVEECHALGARTFATMGEGEPLLYWNELKACVEKAHSLGMYSVIFTNGSLIDEGRAAFFKEMDVSLVLNFQAFTPDAYSELVGGRFTLEKMVEKVKLVLNAYGKEAMVEEGGYRLGRIAFNTVVNARNKEEVPQMREKLAELLGPLHENIIHVMNFPLKMGRASIAENQKVFYGKHKREYREFAELAMHYSDLGGPTAAVENRCRYLAEGATIRPDGAIIPCPYAIAAGGSFGNIRDGKPLGRTVGEVRESWRKFFKKHGDVYCLVRHELYESEYVESLKVRRSDEHG